MLNVEVIPSELLQDHSDAIPIGTVLVAFITSVSYAMVAIICATTMKRVATGSVEDFHNGTHYHCDSHNCTFGVYHDYQVYSMLIIHQSEKKASIKRLIELV